MRARRLRWRLIRRRPWVFWTVTILLASMTALLIAALVEEGEHRVEAWGPGRSVAIATHDLEPGTVVGDGDLRWELRPNVVLTPGVVESGASVVGRVVVTGIYEGEAIMRGRLAPEGVDGLAALLPSGTAAVVIPASARPPRVRVGDTVDLLAASSRVALQTDVGEPVARAAMVIDTADDGAITVAMQRDEAGRAAPAILDGSVVVALVPRR